MGLPDFMGSTPGVFVRPGSYRYQQFDTSRPWLDKDEQMSSTESIRNKSNTSVGAFRTLSDGSKWRLPTDYHRVIHLREQMGDYSLRLLDGTDVFGIDTSLAHFLQVNSYNVALPYFEASTNVLFPENDLSRAVTECLNKLGTRRANLGENIVQASLTASALSKQLGELLISLRKLRRGDISGAAKALHINRPRGWAEPALRWKFGVAPVLRDIGATYDNLMSDLSKPLLISATRSIKGSGDVSRSSWNTTMFGNTIDETITCRGDTRCVINALVNSGAFLANQYGLANPLAFAWELVPLSFVLDWVAPVGNVLYALGDTVGLDFLSGFVSVHASSVNEVVLNPSPNIGFADTTCKGLVKNFGYRRSALTGFPSPEFYIKSPFKISNLETTLQLFAVMSRSSR